MLLAVVMLRSVVCSMLLLVTTGSYTSGGVNRESNFVSNKDSLNSAHIISPVANSNNRLPVKETVPTGKASSNTMVFMISGDSGWNAFDQKTANQFAAQGIPVVGLNSLKYFWKKKSPEQISQDAGQLIEKYASLWNKQHIILLGYSFGADMIPFIYNRLPANLQNRVASIGLMSPSESTDFEVHLSEIFNITSTKRQFSVPEEIAKITSAPVTCFFGRKEAHMAASTLPKECNVVYVRGGHKYEDSFATICQSIVR